MTRKPPTKETKAAPAKSKTHKETYSGSSKPYEPRIRDVGTDLIGKSVGYGSSNDNRTKRK